MRLCQCLSFTSMYITIYSGIPIPPDANWFKVSRGFEKLLLHSKERWQQLVTSPPFLFLILHQWKPQPASSPDDKRIESINSISSSSEGSRYTPSVWFFVSVNRTLNELSQVPFGWHTIHKDIISKTLYFSSSSVIVRDRAASKLVPDLYWLVSFALMLLAVKNAVTFEQSPLVLGRLLSL